MKTKKLCGLAAFLTLSMSGAAALFGQVTPVDLELAGPRKPGGFADSPTSAATFGRFGNAVDDFLSTGWYSGVEFEKFFAYGAFNGPEGIPDGLPIWLQDHYDDPSLDPDRRYPQELRANGQFGFAKRFGSLYLGLGYVGGMGRDWGKAGTVEQEQVLNGTRAGEYKTLTQIFLFDSDDDDADPTPNYTKDAIDRIIPVAVNLDFDDDEGNSHYWYNTERFALLLGVADMGFKLGFATNRKSFKAEDAYLSTATGVKYSELKAENGWMIPSIGWGMARDLTEKGIRPSVDVDFGLYAHKLKGTKYKDLSENDDTENERVEISKNFFEPVVGVGLGGYNFIATEEGFKAGIDLDYQLTMRLYNNEYSILKDGDYVTETVKGVNDSGVLTENKFTSHRIRPMFKFSYAPAESNIQFAARVLVPVFIASKTETQMDLNAQFELKKDGDDITSSYLAFAPAIELAMQYAILGNKLVFSAGGKFTASTITMTTINTSRYNDGEEAEHTSVTAKKTEITSPSIEALSCAVTWNISENVAVEASSGVKADGFNLIGDNSLTSFAQVLARLTF
jgi:hypothetical protein